MHLHLYKMRILKLFCIKNIRYYSTNTNESVQQMRNLLFTKEKLRQESLITRIEKVEVKYFGVPAECTMTMNKNLSTPYHCAMHVHEMLCQRSVIAEVNGKLWDIHRPLTEDCELKLLNFPTSPSALNKVFWRSCSFLLGLIIEKAFKDDYFVNLHSWPKPNVRSGSYVYDADIEIPNWEPSLEELRTFTTMLCKIASEDNNFERLVVSQSLALEMFKDNPFKSEQIPKITSEDEEQCVTLYRVKDHIDISCGPMIANTKFVGTSQVASIHQLDRDSGYRFQAVSIPKQLTLNSFAFGVLVDRAKKLNPTGLKPEEHYELSQRSESASV